MATTWRPQALVQAIDSGANANLMVKTTVDKGWDSVEKCESPLESSVDKILSVILGKGKKGKTGEFPVALTTVGESDVIQCGRVIECLLESGADPAPRGYGSKYAWGGGAVACSTSSFTELFTLLAIAWPSGNKESGKSEGESGKDESGDEGEVRGEFSGLTLLALALRKGACPNCEIQERGYRWRPIHLAASKVPAAAHCPLLPTAHYCPYCSHWAPGH